MTITRALELHRGGFIEEAKAIYESLRLANGRDADVVGLLGMVAFQQGRQEEAEGLWLQSLGLESSPAVYIRNLNNLVATLFENGRIQEAARLLETVTIPVWTQTVAPDERQMNSVLSLALCLQKVDLLGKARALLDSLALYFANNREALKLLAAARLADHAHTQALDVLKGLEPSDDLWTLTARLWCAGEAGDKPQVQRDHDKLLRVASVCRGQNISADRKTVLVINPVYAGLPKHSLFGLHFNGNFPSQMASELQDRFNFISVFDESAMEALDGLRPDVVLNNQVNAEVLSGAGGGSLKDHVSAIADYFHVPVINHPRQAALVTRQRLAWQLKDLPGVFVPRVVRFRANSKEIDFQVKSLADTLGFPLIVRTIANQWGVGMSLAKDRAELVSELQRRDGHELYAHQFVKNLNDTGYFRKIRAAFVGDEIICIRVDFNDAWMVHGRMRRKEFYRENLHFIDIERQILTVPNSILTDKVMQILMSIRKNIPLDIFGMDFDVMPDGRVLFYEANATMNLFDPMAQSDPDIAYFAPANQRLKQVMGDYLERKMAQ